MIYPRSFKLLLVRVEIPTYIPPANPIKLAEQINELARCMPKSIIWMQNLCKRQNGLNWTTYNFFIDFFISISGCLNEGRPDLFSKKPFRRMLILEKASLLIE
ncbi:MAG: hypothetical protein E7L01_09375 [Paenibacillus macerans]|uniref:AAA ATPase domain protein n=1 Tax=Paenibacillus macerans TaxID=44252 RepID=A0A090ZAL5_PAEMA|nr:hypothetical protein [Paenibacillus macerans]KFN08324.1 AAA ATPase domain protein [Paenibacillus macerans]MCY7557127.1 hypothetical protein [Paenibacillus macerans]MDU5946369.1 hypothetical protein [Paenibacillus macerans]MDU7473540.1 hypothetical protein [Paenibacillus macerans]MEC0135414.1 hypothetical protein [Paenibacillus macerans]